VLDAFCGIGNFSLPLSRHFASVLGVEGEAKMVEKAAENARINHCDNVRFVTANLFEPLSSQSFANETFDKILLDPPRAGAESLVRDIARFQAKKIVYISCHPATLARDAGILVNEQGYVMMHAGVMDMFPHTSHVESIAVFALRQ
jgi:23S rRNA (uracil1939-C5)-methyltransferase